jgi:hypothetical protein
MGEDSADKKRVSFSDIRKKLDEITEKNGIDRSSSRFTIDEVCEFLMINQESQEQIKDLPFTKIKVYYDDVINEIKIIPLDELEGVTLRELTNDAYNWLEQLEKINFGKIKNYSDSFEEMSKFLKEDALLQTDDLPIVIEYENKYYIEEGLHRLTIAKCLKIEKFKVKVCQPKKIEVQILNRGK